ncbi:MAG TPA: AraC family transcriptional regulator, partial [Verrucomicrobiae bacterium]|nr:AraC family transcriptional regulator [Verrucomicrobiae bacterium]
RARHHYRERDGGAEQNILIICTQGRGCFEINGRSQNLCARQALLIPKGQAHAYWASQRDPWTIQWVHFLGDEAPYYFTLLKSGRFTLPLHSDLAGKVDQLFGDAYDVLSGGFSLQSIICAAQALRHILGWLFFNNKAFSPHTKGTRMRNLDDVIQFMKGHLDASLTVEEMARQTALSTGHFSRLFSQQTGFPPMDYFIHLKMQRACRFLTLTHLTVKEISSRLGYDDPYYFSRIFHKVIGSSPAAYRQVKLG